MIGAGKSTLLSILCGNCSQSSGTVTIYEHDSKMEMKKIRSLLGVCPQENILFDQLTVTEHIMAFAGIKGMR